jgi:hypothetical protein
MFHLFQTYVAANTSCCKCSMSRREKWAQTEVVPAGTAVPAAAKLIDRTKPKGWGTGVQTRLTCRTSGR